MGYEIFQLGQEVYGCLGPMPQGLNRNDLRWLRRKKIVVPAGAMLCGRVMDIFRVVSGTCLSTSHKCRGELELGTLPLRGQETIRQSLNISLRSSNIQFLILSKGLMLKSLERHEILCYCTLCKSRICTVMVETSDALFLKKIACFQKWGTGYAIGLTHEDLDLSEFDCITTQTITP